MIEEGLTDENSPLTRLAKSAGVTRAKFLEAVQRVCRLQKDDALLVVLLTLADRYEMDPLRKEIGIMNTKEGPQVYVSVDGWFRVIERHPDNLGFNVQLEFKAGADPLEAMPLAATATLYSRKRREAELGPFVWTERLAECQQIRRSKETGATIPGPWQTNTTRMLRFRALQQGARVLWGMYVPTPDDLMEADAARDREQAAADAPPAPTGPATMIKSAAPALVVATKQSPDERAPETVTPAEVLDVRVEAPEPVPAQAARREQKGPAVAISSVVPHTARAAPKAKETSAPVSASGLPEYDEKASLELDRQVAAQDGDLFDLDLS